MREYKYTPADGMPTTVLLDDEEAKKRGLKPGGDEVATKEAAAPKNKARTSSAKRAEAVSGAWGAKGKTHSVSGEADEDE